MAETFAGNLGTVVLSLEDSPTVAQLVVAERAVVNLIVEPQGADAHVRLNVGAGAGVHFVLSNLPQRGSVEVDVAAGATFTLSLVGSQGSGYNVSSLVRLVGDGANAHLQVAVVGAGEGVAELSCTVEHIAPHTFARIIARRVETGSSASILRGMLKVGVGAHGTDTYLSDKALLMGEHTRAESVPGLEILADDVRASHGATVGRPSKEELFYLRSRGLPVELAEQLLVRAFLAPALIGVPPEVAARLERNLASYATTQPA